jgi:chemotaxis protein methyltransferase CheR
MDAMASPHVFAILFALVEERIGLHHGPAEASIFMEKVAGRAAEAGFDSLLDYYYRLRYDDPEGRELDELVEHLVVGETYFFREVEPLRLLVDDFLLPACAAGRRPRVLSAACSTGEEPLTLAMLLAGRGLLGRVDLVAADISRRALARAREGVFSARSLRGSGEPELEARWLRRREGRVECDPALVRSIDWRRANLLRPGELAALGRFDAIVCRNVLIYFRDATAARLVSSFAEALEPGGALLVGVSESLLRLGAPLECQERRGVFVYVKAPP